MESWRKEREKGKQAEVPPDVADISAVTLCELGGKLQHITNNEDPILSYYVHAEGIIFPDVKLPYAFADPTNVQYPMAKTRTTMDTGVAGALDELLVSVLNGWRHHQWYISAIMENMLDQSRRVVSMTTRLIGRRQLSTGSRRNYYEALLQQLDKAPVKLVAWHGYRQVLAIVHRQDSVHIYDIVSEKWFPTPPVGLTHEHQKSVTCAAWNPQSGTMLAVGSSVGVCLWRLVLDRNEYAYNRDAIPCYIEEPSNCHGWVKLLRFPGFENVTCLTWSPDGQFLAVGSGFGPSLIVWDVALSTPIPVGVENEGTTGLWWSPNGEYLIQTTQNLIRIWETRTWTNQKLEVEDDRPHSVCWMPNSKIFMFALYQKAAFQVWQMDQPPPSLVSKKLDRIRPSKFELTMPSGARIQVGGPIKMMSLDPTGRRLAVTFEGEHPGAELVAIYAVQEVPLPKFERIGYARGPRWHPRAPQPQPPRSPDRVTTNVDITNNARSQHTQNAEDKVDITGPLPVAMTFAPHFDKGALLTIGWENGKVGFLPMYLT